MYIWDDGQKRGLSFDLNQHAYIIENDLVVHVLKEKVKAMNNVDIWFGTSLKKVDVQQEKLARVTTDKGQEVDSKLIIGADGFQSTVRKSMKDCTYISKAYNQMGVVATLHLAKPISNHVAIQKFLPTGPIALLPLSQEKSSLVWTLPTNEAQKMLKFSEEEFLAELLKKLGKVPLDMSEPFPQINRVRFINSQMLIYA